MTHASPWCRRAAASRTRRRWTRPRSTASTPSRSASDGGKRRRAASRRGGPVLTLSPPRPPSLAYAFFRVSRPAFVEYKRILGDADAPDCRGLPGNTAPGGQLSTDTVVGSHRPGPGKRKPCTPALALRPAVEPGEGRPLSCALRPRTSGNFFPL